MVVWWWEWLAVQAASHWFAEAVFYTALELLMSGILRGGWWLCLLEQALALDWEVGSAVCSQEAEWFA